MWKLDFYMLPSDCYQDLCGNDIVDLEKKTEYLKRNERLYVPNEIYDKEDRNGLDLATYLYNCSQDDNSDFLLEIITKQKMCQDTYEMIEQKEEYGYLPMAVSDTVEGKAHLCVKEIEDKEQAKYLDVNDIIKVKRFYLAKVISYDIYKERAESCYPHLIFHEDAFKNVQGLGRCRENARELTRHLTVLNDVGKKLFDYYKNEKAVLSEMKSGYGIECSGKGSKQEESFNKEMIFGNQKYQLTCNPHTKLYGKRTDKRIYFCWGRDEIEGHRIIIVRIGSHWQE